MYLKKFPLLVLTLLTFLIIQREAKASHLYGGEVTYKYLDANGPGATPFRYRLTYNVYVNCGASSNVPLGNANITVRVFNKSNGALVTNVTAPRVSNPIISPPLPAGCNVPGLQGLCVRLVRYETTVNLPLSFDGYYAVYTESTRNAGINNLQNSGSTSMTLYIDMAPPLLPNESPIFSDTAVVIVCRGDTATIINNAVDRDGDRLIYSFATPYDRIPSPTNFTPPPIPVVYATGFSETLPFGNGGSATINATTGLTKYYSPIAGNFVVSMQVKEFRNINGVDVLIGSTTRDIQLLVRDCDPNASPQFSPQSTAQTEFFIDAGARLTFNVGALDADNNQNLTISATGPLFDAPYNATFPAATGLGAVSSTFTFNSVCGQSGTFPVVVKVKDDGCPPKTTSLVYLVHIKPFKAPEKITGKDSVCTSNLIQTYRLPNTNYSSYTWKATNGTILSAQNTDSIRVQWNSSGNSNLRVVVRSGLNCIDSVSYDINLIPAPNVSAGNNVAICPGATIPLQASGAQTYRWSPSTGLSNINIANPVANPTATTTYTVTGTNANGCSSTSQVTVTVNPPAVANAGPDRVVCSNQSTNIGAAAVSGSTYSWSPTTGLSSSTAANPTVTLTNTGTNPQTTSYILTVTNSTGCIARDTVDVIVNPFPQAIAGNNRTLCSNEASVLGSASVAGTTYSWSPSTGLSNASISNPTVQIINTGTAPIIQTYTVSVTRNNCTSTAQVQVTINPAAIADAGAPKSFCSGFNATLGTAGLAGYNYNWSPATGLSATNVAQPVVTLTNTGSTPQTLTYTVTATNSFGCIATSQVTVTVNPAVVSNAGPNKTTCSGVPVSIGTASTAGFTYSWSPTTGLSSSTAAEPTVNLSNTGTTPQNTTYTLTTTNSFGCVATSQVTVTINPASIANAGAAKAFCSSKSTEIGTTALAGYTYSWSPATGLSSNTAAQPTLSLVNPGSTPQLLTYTVTATNSFGCSSTSQVQVTVNPTPSTDNIVGSPSVCPGVLGVEYRIQNPQSTNYQWIINGGTIASGQGTNRITVNWGGTNSSAFVKAFSTNAQGCSSDTVTYRVIVNQLLATQKPTGPLQLCASSAKNIQYQTGFTNGSIYEWQAIGGTITSPNPGGNTVTINWNTLGTGKLLVKETSTTSQANCFGISDTLYVNILPSPDSALTINGVISVCANTNNIPFSINGMTGSTYQWTLNGSPLSGNTKNISVNFGAAGNYTLSVVETTAQGCIGKRINKAIVVNPIPVPLVISGPAIICPEKLAGHMYSVNGFTGSTYQWAVTGGTVKSGNGTNSVIIEFDNSPVKTISVVETSQFGCTGSSNSRTLTFDNTSIVLDAISTIESNEKEIVISFNMPNNAANPNGIVVSKREFGSTTWTNLANLAKGATTFTDTQVDPDTKSYEYKVETTNACGTLLSSDIHRSIKLAVNGDEPNELALLGWNAYKGWKAGIKTYEIYRKIDDETTWKLIATTSDTTISFKSAREGFNQCFRIKAVSNDTQARLSWSNDNCVQFENPIHIYNIFTPNGDGINETFNIENIKIYKDTELTIYNRYGNQVYKKLNYDNTWDGKGLSDGTYFYHLKLNNGKTFKGWVEISR